MLTRPAELWRCTNAKCAEQTQLELRWSADTAVPRCACGAAMKKEYRSPVFRYLEFLKLDERVPADDVVAAPEAKEK